MYNPYETPKSELTNSRAVAKVSVNVKLIALMALCHLLIVILSWFVIPDTLNYFLDGNENSPSITLLVLDLLFSFLAFAFSVTLFTFIARKNAYWFSISSGIVLFVIFYQELGGVSAIGKAGLPYWYDLSSFCIYPFKIGVSGYIGNKLRNKKEQAPING